MTDIRQPDISDVDAARAYLKGISTPMLDEFRKQLTKQPTSSLIGWLAHPMSVMRLMADKNLDDEQLKVVASATMLSISEEIDRRVPATEVSRIIT